MSITFYAAVIDANKTLSSVVPFDRHDHTICVEKEGGEYEVEGRPSGKEDLRG